jgi:hypothetical protein
MVVLSSYKSFSGYVSYTLASFQGITAFQGISGLVYSLLSDASARQVGRDLQRDIARL